MMRDLTAAVIALSLAGWATAQQSTDLTRPPPIGDTQSGSTAPSADGAQAQAVPGAASPAGQPAASERNESESDDRAAVAARLAAAEEARTLPMEEVIVIDESEWRLPDLGSEWRRAQSEEPDDGRIQLAVFPLYDPENRDPVEDLYERNSELHRVGMIEVIRLRFGGRPQD